MPLSAPSTGYQASLGYQASPVLSENPPSASDGPVDGSRITLARQLCRVFEPSAYPGSPNFLQLGGRYPVTLGSSPIGATGANHSTCGGCCEAEETEDPSQKQDNRGESLAIGTWRISGMVFRAWVSGLYGVCMDLYGGC